MGEFEALPSGFGGPGEVRWVRVWSVGGGGKFRRIAGFVVDFWLGDGMLDGLLYRYAPAEHKLL